MRPARPENAVLYSLTCGRSWLHDHFDAAVLFGSERFVEFRAFFKCRSMGDDERRIDFTLLDAFEKLGQIVLDRCLGHAEGEAAVDGRSHRNFVEQPAVNADNRDGPEVTATVDRLPKNMRSVRSHERRDLDAVDDGVEAGAGVRLGADGIDAGVRTAAVGHFLDPVVDVLFLEIQRDGARGLRQGETLRDGVDGDHPFCARAGRRS